jgi:uncharacterized iron-regulated membrane protein
MRNLHRWTMTIAALFLIYVASTGVVIQLIDMATLYLHAPASSPNMRSIHDGINGAPGFEVISVTDYAAKALPASADPEVNLATVLAAARAVVPAEPFNWVELRMDGDRPVGVVALGGSHPHQLKFDALTGAALGSTESPPLFGGPGHSQSAHDLVKDLHRGNMYGNVGLWLNLFTGIALLVMTISGLLLYFKLLGVRRKTGRTQWFWR